MSMPPIHDMVVFANVVEAQGFTAAADRLGISKSAVSKSVAALEEHLGVRLLHRTTRKLKLTDAGIAFNTHCANILAEAAAAELAVGRMDGRPRGRIKVNTGIALGRSLVLPVVLSFLESYPDVEVDLRLQDDIVDLVATGTDVAVRVGRLLDGSLVARKLAPVRTFLVASASYLEKHGMPTTPEELINHRFILYTLTPKPEQLVLVGPNDERAVIRMQGSLYANNGEVILDACLAGVGIGVMPDFIGTSAFCNGTLKVVLPEWQFPATSIHAVYSQGGPVTPIVRLFVDALVARTDALKRIAGDRPFALALNDLE